MHTLRVMSFNIASTLDDGEGANHWHNQHADLNVRVIRRFMPDLIGFQEVDHALPGDCGSIVYSKFSIVSSPRPVFTWPTK